jgi:hypothetical protein
MLSASPTTAADATRHAIPPTNQAASLRSSTTIARAITTSGMNAVKTSSVSDAAFAPARAPTSPETTSRRGPPSERICRAATR